MGGGQQRTLLKKFEKADFIENVVFKATTKIISVNQALNSRAEVLTY